MDKHRMLRIAGWAGIGPVALAGVVGSGLFIAQASQDDNAPANGGAVLAQQAASSPMDDYIKKLAANLGIDEQKLRDALQTTSLQEIDAAVAAGKLTQAQADKIKEAINSGKIMMGGIGIHGGAGGPGGAGPGIGDRGMHIGIGGADVATFLGITEEQLRTELQGGKTLAQVAAAHGKTRDQLKTYLTEQNSAHIDAAVTAGKMTADQAAKAKAAFAAAVDAMIDGTMPAKPSGAPDMGGRGPRGGMLPGMPGGGTQPGTVPGATQRGVN